MPHSTPLPLSASASDARPRVLIMDDDPLFRTLLVSLLKRDYHVTAAADGSDGFYKGLECPPDVAVIDIQMPVWDGIRTLGAFRENAKLKRVPLLVLTSDASQETVLAAIAAGADDYVIKSSFSREEFLQKMLRIRDRRQRQPSATDRAANEGLNRESALAPASRLQEVIDAWE